MKHFLRAAWSLVLALCLATSILVPQTLTYLFPAETSGYVLIAETGVDPDQVRQLAEQVGVEVAQVRHTTEAIEGVNEPVSTTAVEILGHDAEEYVHPPLTSLFLSESVVYSGSTVQDNTLGTWSVIGPADSVTQLISQMRDRWGAKISRSEVLTPALVRSTALRSSLGLSLLLTEVVLALVLAIKALSQPSQYRYALILGRSHTRLGLRMLRDNLLAATRWVLAPLALLCLSVIYDSYASAPLSVHTITLELITWSVALTLVAVVLGTLTGWVTLVAKGRRRSGGEARPSHALALLTYATALIMVWSFSTASSDLVTSVLEQQTLRSQAKAQDSLPHAISLSIWSVSESTFTELDPQVKTFMKDQEANGDLFLVWAVADGYTSDASGPPTLYLNNAAATHYGLPAVSSHEVALYLPADLAPQEALLTQRILDDAEFQAQTGASAGEDVSVTVRDQAEATSALPPSLPAVSYFFSSQGTQTSDCLIEVVPDGYFAPTNYLSAVTQGASVFTDHTMSSLRQDLRDHQLEDLVARLDTVGDGHAGVAPATTQRMLVYVLILLASAAGAVASTSLSVRAWAQARRRRREISRMLGRSRMTEHLVTALLAIPPVLVLSLPLLSTPYKEVLLTQLGCALTLIVTVIATTRPLSTRHQRTTRHG